MNYEEQLETLYQILDTLHLAASRVTDEQFKKYGNKEYNLAIQNTKKLITSLNMNGYYVSPQDLPTYGESLGLYNLN